MHLPWKQHRPRVGVQAAPLGPLENFKDNVPGRACQKVSLSHYSSVVLLRRTQGKVWSKHFLSPHPSGGGLVISAAELHLGT